MLEPIKYETVIELKNIPYAWLSSIQLFDPYLLNYPIQYIHLQNKDKRIYGFPVAMGPSSNKYKTGGIKFIFLSNIDLDKDKKSRVLVTDELMERIGANNVIDMNTILRSCKNNKGYKKIFKELWERNIKKYYGNSVPFGRFYEEFYSIVRFCAAFNPSSGRKSEMQMVYDFISNYGKKIKIEGKYNHLQFYLLPTYDDLKKESLDDFPVFKSLYFSILKIFGKLFTGVNSFGNLVIKFIQDRTDMFQSGKKYRKMTSDLVATNEISKGDKQNLDFLLDAFNRYPGRARIFISFIGNIKEGNKYESWTKDEFIYFYENNPPGFSMKVAGCFLQQGFGNAEVIPVDNWVESFYQNILDITGQKEAQNLKKFLTSFDNLGKIERVIWLLSQARKTNNSMVFDQMWCIKYGVPYDELRGPNPLSCYECKLRNVCPSFSDINDKKILIKEIADNCTEEVYDNKGKLKFIRISENTFEAEAGLNSCSFICLTQQKTPKFIFKKIRNKWILIDEYSGFFVHDKTLDENIAVLTVKDFLNRLGEFNFDFSPSP